MEKEKLIELKEKLSKLTEKEQMERDLYLRKLATGEIQGPPTGYGSIDKPWLKYYPEKTVKSKTSEKNIYEYILERNKNRLDKIAINYFGKKITYKQLFESIDTAAKAFNDMGIKKGDIVTLSSANTPQNAISIYALNKLGAIANIIDLRLKGEKLKKAINLTESKLIVTTDLFISNLDEVINETSIENVIVTSPFDSMPLVLNKLLKLKNKQKETKNMQQSITWDEFYKKGKKITEELNVQPSKSDDGICIMHTSGTTGDSKGVLLKNKTFNAMVLQYEDNVVTIKDGERLLSQVPPFLAYSAIMAIHLPLSLGLRIEMLPDYKPEKFAENVYKHKTAHAVAGPADWNNFLEDKNASKRDYSFLSTLGSGSDKISTKKRKTIDKILENAGCKNKIIEGYGMTEVGSAAVTNIQSHIVDESVGIPLPKMCVQIYDNELETECQYNEQGEICFHGDTMMKAYFNNPTATENTMKLHSDGKYWIHSGDIGYMDPNGNIFLQGRIKRLILRHDGIKISPYDIEKIVLEVDGVKDCCTVAIDDLEHGYGSVPGISVVIKEEFKPETEEILDKINNKCNNELSEKYLPKQIRTVDELPLTPVGKIDYRQLEKESNAIQKQNKVLKK